MAAQLDCEKLNSIKSGLLDAEDTQTIVNILSRISTGYGFVAATILVMPARSDKVISHLVLSSQLPDAFFADYDRLGGSASCIFFEALRATILPVTWTLQEMLNRYRNLGRKMPETYALHEKYGLTMGIGFPVTTVDGSRNVILYEGDRKLLTPMEVAELHMLTLHVFEAYDRVRGRATKDTSALTARELEVVRWTAAGKTSVEIGLIMELSDHTVNAYMNNAFKKLDCVSRTQLVAKALRLRLIA